MQNQQKQSSGSQSPSSVQYAKKSANISQQKISSSPMSNRNDTITYEPSQYTAQNLKGRNSGVKMEQFRHAFSALMDTHSSMQQRVRSFQLKLHDFLDKPSSSMYSLVWNIFIAVLIVLAAICMSLETVDRLYQDNQYLWYLLDSIITYVFTLELFLRLISKATGVKKFCKYLVSPLFIIDVLSIAPYYAQVVQLHFVTLTAARLSGLRLLRIFRLFKSFRFLQQFRFISISFEIAGESVRKSLGPLFPLFFTMAVAIMILGTVMYYAERGTYDVTTNQWLLSNGEVSKFTSIPESMWFVSVTLTTTGYGDLAPTTFAGRLCAFIGMLFGLLLVALPSLIIGRNYTILWQNLKARNAIPEIPDWLNKAFGRSGSYHQLSDKNCNALHDVHVVDTVQESPDVEFEMNPYTSSQSNNVAPGTNSRHYVHTYNQSSMSKVYNIGVNDTDLDAVVQVDNYGDLSLSPQEDVNKSRMKNQQVHNSRFSLIEQHQKSSPRLMSDRELILHLMQELSEQKKMLQQILNATVGLDDEELMKRLEDQSES
ncbi:hypothetical protein MIR68_000848 [Amoeboaphelidium protococcarum]|nr:hypothetical protein MIR68_000848 [Amoeboaphelidium protococcarum]